MALMQCCTEAAPLNVLRVRRFSSAYRRRTRRWKQAFFCGLRTAEGAPGLLRVSTMTYQPASMAEEFQVACASLCCLMPLNSEMAKNELQPNAPLETTQQGTVAVQQTFATEVVQENFNTSDSPDWQVDGGSRQSGDGTVELVQCRDSTVQLLPCDLQGGSTMSSQPAWMAGEFQVERSSLSCLKPLYAEMADLVLIRDYCSSLQHQRSYLNRLAEASSLLVLIWRQQFLEHRLRPYAPSETAQQGTVTVQAALTAEVLQQNCDDDDDSNTSDLSDWSDWQVDGGSRQCGDASAELVPCCSYRGMDSMELAQGSSEAQCSAVLLPHWCFSDGRDMCSLGTVNRKYFLEGREVMMLWLQSLGNSDPCFSTMVQQWAPYVKVQMLQTVAGTDFQNSANSDLPQQNISRR